MSMRVVSERADVVVVGGGPAGSTVAGLLAAQGLRVTLLEHSCYESARFGEVLSPHVVPLLESLGVMSRFMEDKHMPSPGMVSAWGGAQAERSSLMNPYGDGWHVNRVRFDRMLAEAAVKSGACLYTRARLKSVARHKNGSAWALKLSTPDCERELRTDFLIDATGRAAKLARRLGARHERVDRLVSVMALGEAVSAGDPRMLVEAAPDGWWYSAHLLSGHTVFAYLTDADLVLNARHGSRLKGFELALRNAPQTFARAHGIRFSTARITSAASTRLPSPAGLDWLAVGDAATAFDPLSGHGMVRAITSGLYAAQVIARYLSESSPANKLALIEDYIRRCRMRWSNYLLERRRIYGSERRWQDSIFWQRRKARPLGSGLAGLSPSALKDRLEAHDEQTG